MKKDKEWLKEEMYSMYPSYNEIYVSPDYETVVKVQIIDEALELIDQLDEPEQTDTNVGLSKPVIPKFVANFIRATKPNNSLRLAFEYIAQQKIDNYDDGLAFWIEEGNSELFASAWLDGYEVEKEPQWVVKQKKLYLKSFDVWREEDNNVEFVLDKESTIKFSDKAKAEAVAILVDGEVEEVM